MPKNIPIYNKEIPSGKEYIQQIAKRANYVSDRIHKLKIKEQQLKDQLSMFRKQKTNIKAILDYTKQVDTISDDLKAELKEVRGFFTLPSDGTRPSPAQMDLPPADGTLIRILSEARGVAGRLYQSLINLNSCVLALDRANDIVLKAMGAVPSDTSDDGDPFGHLEFSSGASDELLAKFKAAIDSGMATMETMANTGLTFIQFLHQTESLYHTCSGINTELNNEIRQVIEFDNRNEVRVATESRFLNEIQIEIDKTQSELEETSATLEALTTDYNLLKTEFEAANASISPAKKVESGSVPATA